MRKANPTSSEQKFNACSHIPPGNPGHAKLVLNDSTFCIFYRRRRLKFAGFHPENLQKYPKNPVNPV
jgi:hypothetical protein